MEARLEPVLTALPYALRGVSTPELPFNAVGQIMLPQDLPPALATVLPAICEPCILYRALDVSLKHSSAEGLFKQALFSAVRESLRSYLALVSEIETHITQQPSQFTLARAQAILQAPCVYLRLFYSILQHCMRNRGNILSVIWEFTNHGDPLVASYSQELFETVNEPFRRIRDQWESLGSLQLDLFGEFYIAQSSESDEDEFRIVESNIPSGIMSSEDVEISFERGSAMHFIRKICGDLDFTGVGKTSAQIMEHSRKLLVEDNQLMLHLRGLRDYMLLCNGNFVDALFRNDTTHFLKSPVNDVGSYLASEFFLAAIDDAKQVNENPLVTRALDAKIMGIEGVLRNESRSHNGNHSHNGSRNHNDDTVLVWEVFVGKYHIDARPLRCIVDTAATRLYERCFASLWRVRFAVQSLNESATKLRLLMRRQDANSIDKDDKQLLFQVHAMMNQFFLKIQMHLYYDVIEKEWLTLANVLTKSKTLTIAQIRQAHTAYLAQIVDATAEPSQFKVIDLATRQVLAFENWLDGEFDDGNAMRRELLQFQTEFESLHKIN